MTENTKQLRIGYAVCGSFCTLGDSLTVLTDLCRQYTVIPIFSENAYSTDTRFGKAEDIRSRVADITGQTIRHRIVDTEVFGAKDTLDLLIVSPCTGNTLAKIANGITDTAVTMAVKAQLRSDRPVLLALASNDAMSANLKNIAALLCRKNVYFVPMIQDAPEQKPYSLVADFSELPDCLTEALAHRQKKPLFAVGR